MTLALLFIVAAGLFLYEDSRAGRPDVTMTHPAWMTPLVRRLAVCETGGNPWFRHPDGYEGIVAWLHTTWLADKPAGAPRHAYQASLRQQHRAALTSLRRHRYFGCLVGAEHAWVRG